MIYVKRGINALITLVVIVFASAAMSGSQSPIVHQITILITVLSVVIVIFSVIDSKIGKR